MCSISFGLAILIMQVLSKLLMIIGLFDKSTKKIDRTGLKYAVTPEVDCDRCDCTGKRFNTLFILVPHCILYTLPTMKSSSSSLYMYERAGTLAKHLY